ncbi:hypothetical protein GOP47_0007188 [Adiantum capillus-veneris]|uniref:Uncharacterized protein n=1 Tax=Adiantum capillus-veneris TaxID=13818 RepID=A0A9D4ZJ26_ADICA|nr:hypothetical protein GOP47_0007188 [Adiantum capillus-veneris]
MGNKRPPFMEQSLDTSPIMELSPATPSSMVPCLDTPPYGAYTCKLTLHGPFLVWSHAWIPLRMEPTLASSPCMDPSWAALSSLPLLLLLKISLSLVAVRAYVLKDLSVRYLLLGGLHKQQLETMSTSKKKSFRIEPFKHKVEIDPKYAERTWRVLDDAINEIYNHNASGLSFEELYRQAFFWFSCLLP